MGHIRLGRLPKTLKWYQVLEAIKSDEPQLAKITNTTLEATGRDLSKLSNEQAVFYPFWILVQLIAKVGNESYSRELNEIGIETSDINSTLEFINRISEVVQQEVRRIRDPKDLISDIAIKSFIESLTRIASTESQSLFGTTFEDVRNSIKKFNSSSGFAELSRIYFANFLNRYLQYYLSKETSNLINSQSGLKNIGDLIEFDESIKNYSIQSAKIIEDFSGGWFSKKKWLGELTENDIKSFLYVAFKKLKSELDFEVSK